MCVWVQISAGDQWNRSKAQEQHAEKILRQQKLPESGRDASRVPGAQRQHLTQVRLPDHQRRWWDIHIITLWLVIIISYWPIYSCKNTFLLVTVDVDSDYENVSWSHVHQIHDYRGGGFGSFWSFWSQCEFILHWTPSNSSRVHQHLHVIVFTFCSFDQSFKNHNRTFHKLFPEIPETEDLGHGEFPFEIISSEISWTSQLFLTVWNEVRDEEYKVFCFLNVSPEKKDPQ